MSMEKVILGILTSFVQSYGIIAVIFSIIPAKTNLKKFIFFLFMFTYGIITFFFIPNQFRFIMFVTIISLLLRFIMNIKDSRCILFSFLFTMIFSFSEIFISLILILIGINSYAVVNNSFYNLIANIFISFLSVWLSNMNIVRKLISNLHKIFIKNKNLVKYLYLILIMLYLITLKNGLEFILKSNYYINIFFIVGIVVIFSIIIKNELRYDQLNEQNKQMLNYVTKYEKIIADQGKANHEFRNQLMVIRGYAQMKSPKLIEYLDSIVDDTKKTHSSYLISQLNKFPDGGIKGLLYYKLSIMDDENIKYEINVDTGVKTKLKSLDTVMYKNITKILGVLLDNAIDASKQSKNKRIIISVANESSKVIFNISNSYKGKVDVSKLSTGYTTKGKGHGYGLRLVKDIIEENNIFEIQRLVEDNYFVTSFSILIKRKKK